MAKRPKASGWGGKRQGAGRKPNGPTAGVGHRSRPALKKLPVYVIWTIRAEVWKGKTRECHKALAAALEAGASGRGFKLVQHAVKGNKLHLLVEAQSKTSLSKGMGGLGVRISRGVNKVLERTGKFFGDRYDADVLRTPAQLQHARENFA
jgi:REP element-mobilizing transposase RayT